MVDLGLVTGVVGAFSLSSIVALSGGVDEESNKCIKLSREHTLKEKISFLANSCTFVGAIPTEISYLHAVSSNIQTQLNNKASLASPAFTGTASLGGQHIATTNQIHSLTVYAPLVGPPFNGAAT